MKSVSKFQGKWEATFDIWGGDSFCEVRACNAFIRREFHWKGEYPINIGYILPTNTKLVSFANYTTAINIFNEENNYDCIRSLIDWADSSFSGKVLEKSL